jgi:hypothetical protein
MVRPRETERNGGPLRRTRCVTASPTRILPLTGYGGAHGHAMSEAPNFRSVGFVCTRAGVGY